jgi:hypothetical protein
MKKKSKKNQYYIDVTGLSKSVIKKLKKILNNKTYEKTKVD